MKIPNEARASELTKLSLKALPVEFRRNLLAELERIIATMTDPYDIESLNITISNVKATLD
jgi:hypothetical protein